MEMRLELLPVPVTDVGRAAELYVDKAGFTADVDQVVCHDVRFVQLTPPDSAGSIIVEKGPRRDAAGEQDGRLAPDRRSRGVALLQTVGRC